ETKARVALCTLRTSAGVEATDRALELGAGPSARLVRAYLDQARFRNVAAAAAADSARALAPHDLSAVRAAGELRLGGGMVGTADLAGAEEAFRAALALDSTDVRSRFGLAWVLVHDGRHEEGTAWLDGVLRDRPRWAEACYLRGLARMRGRDLEAAAADFARAVELDPVHAGAWFNRGRVLERTGARSGAEQARQRATHARDLQKRVNGAAVAWHSGGDPSAGLALVSALREAGRLESALVLAMSIEQDHPGHPVAALELAETALLVPDAEVARGAAERARAAAPDSPRAALLAARAAEAAGDAAAARDHARDLSRLAPDEPEALALLTGLLLDDDRPEEALSRLDAALSAPPDLRLAARRARALVALERFDEAEPLLDRLLAAQARAEWLELRAAARAGRGRLAPARDDLRLAVELAPHRAAAWSALAGLHEREGDAAEAERCREKARRLEEGERAVVERRRAWRMAPGDPEVAGALAAALEAAGEPMRAARVREWTDGFGRVP
ncbi:MAG TPA: tetratricopeptide repeat protein, partial [bacterium]|nr:tetratricopeptide repeat protein [bacterium]